MGELFELVGLEGGGPLSIEVSGVESQTRLVESQNVGGPGGAQEDEGGVGGADAGKLPQRGERLVWLHLGEIRRVQPAVQRGARDNVQSFDLDRAQTRKRPQPQQVAGKGKGVDGLTTELEASPNRLRQAVPDDDGLGAGTAHPALVLGGRGQ